MTPAGVSRKLAALGPILAIVASLYLAFAPWGYQESFVEVSSDGVVTRNTETSRSLVDVEGPDVFIPLSIPPALSFGAFGLLMARRGRLARWTARLTWVFCFVGAMSIGLFYVPAAAALTIASRRRRWRDRTSLAPSG